MANNYTGHRTICNTDSFQNGVYARPYNIHIFLTDVKIENFQLKNDIYFTLICNRVCVYRLDIIIFII